MASCATPVIHVWYLCVNHVYYTCICCICIKFAHVVYTCGTFAGILHACLTVLHNRGNTTCMPGSPIKEYYQRSPNGEVLRGKLQNGRSPHKEEDIMR